MKRITAIGAVGKDEHIKIDSVRKLPAPFQSHVRRTAPLSRITELYGDRWTPQKAFETLRRRCVEPIHYGYGGRAPHVAYGIALLGGAVTLVTSFGDDYDESYPGFFGGGYSSHLKKAGVDISASRISLPEDKWNNEDAPQYLRRNYGEILMRSSTIIVEGKKTSTITCVKDLDGLDFFYLDDVSGAGTIERWRPIPREILKTSDIVFVTSSEREFMQKAVDQAYQYGKMVVVDVASYDVTPEYLRRITPRSTVLLGNESEIQQVLDAYEVRTVEEVFEAHTELPSHVVIEDKFNGFVEIHSRKRREKQKIGPVKFRKTGSGTGVCDAIATGILASLQRDLSLMDGAAAGLIEGASVWEVEGVQEGMLKKDDFIRRFEEEFSSRLQDESIERVRRSFM